MSASPIFPGATIGFLGGGQLGRMTAMAARSMGYDVHVLDPEAACATGPVASRVITAPFTDVAAAVDLARHCDVITLEIEQIHPDVLDAAADERTCAGARRLRRRRAGDPLLDGRQPQQHTAVVALRARRRAACAHVVRRQGRPAGVVAAG